MSREFQSELFPALPASPEVVVPATPPTTDSIPSTPSAAPRESAAKSPSASTLNTTLTHILQKLELMPEPATRFALCEKQVQNHAEVLAEGSTQAMKGAIYLALIHRDELFKHAELPLEATTSPTAKQKAKPGEDTASVPRTFTQWAPFAKYYYPRWGFSTAQSASRVNRLLNAGLLALELHALREPLPSAPEKLVRMLPLKQQAAAGWQELLGQAAVRLPTLAEIDVYVAARRPKKKDKAPTPWERFCQLVEDSRAAVKKQDLASAQQHLDTLHQLIATRTQAKQPKSKE